MKDPKILTSDKEKAQKIVDGEKRDGKPTKYEVVIKASDNLNLILQMQ